ncbi:MAG TPA: MarR family transcriptional regulator [Oscillospiraceae bacterium]|nr:MarR family transcriptional regulator [Oscillospiraceae bacterium]
MDNADRETTQKLMDLFSRFRRLHRGCPIPGLKNSELRILFGVKKSLTMQGCGARISDLSHVMRVTSPTVTQLVNSLESSGLVERTTDPQDRRSIRVVLTTKGEETIQAAADEFFSEFYGLVKHLGEEKSQQLIELLVECFDYLRNSTPTKFAGETE